MSTPTPSGTPPSRRQLLARGLTRRCPACGQNKLFRRWLIMSEKCPRCGLVFERIEGHWVGAVGLNTIVSFGSLIIILIVGVIATFPDIATVPLVIISVAAAVGVPLAFDPVSRTLWTGIDIAMRPLEPFEVDWTQLQRN
ncbi:MAG: DUF983 domain-containing protein [Actinomycetota bacterium]